MKAAYEYDLFGGALSRDVGIAKAWASEPKETAINAFRVLDEFKGQIIMVERVKVRYQLRGYKKPNNPQAWWGAWTLKAIDQRKLIPLEGRPRPTACRTSNRRRAAVYYVP
jgi:hypothetical protein